MRYASVSRLSQYQIAKMGELVVIKVKNLYRKHANTLEVRLSAGRMFINYDSILTDLRVSMFRLVNGLSNILY